MPPPPAPAAGSGEDDDFDWDDLDDEDDEAPAPVVAVKTGPIPFKEPSPATPAAPPPPPAAAAPPPPPAAAALPPAAAAPPAPTASPPAATKPGPPPAVFSRPGAAPPAAVTPTTPAAAAGPRPPAPAATGGQRRVVPPPPAAPGGVPPPPAPAAAAAAPRAAPPAATAVRPLPPPAAATAAGTAAAGPSPAAVPAPPQSGTPPSSSRPAAPGSPTPGSAAAGAGAAAAGAAAAARPEGQPSQAAPPAAAPSPPPEQRQQPPMARSSSGGGSSAGKPPRPQPAARSAPDAGSAGGNAGSSSSGGSAGGSWGGWGLGGLSNKLQQVALGAAKDLQELTASVQQVVAEVVAADDVSEAERLSAYQPQPSHPPALPPGATSAPPAPLTARRDSSGTQLSAAAGDSSTSELAAAGGGGEGQGELELKRQQVLQKLQGQDTQLESGLKVIDEQVDMLAASVAKGLGSLWGGLNTVAKTSWTVGAALTNKVEAAAQEVVKELVVGLEEGVSAVAPAAAGAASLREAAEQLAARAERSLETVGRGAAQLLDPQFARRHQPGDGASGGGRSAADWEATFGSCFELYGGSQAAEELEQLSSECAHICNRARAELAQQHRDQIDRSLSLLLPAFDLSKPKQPSAQGDAAAAPSVDEAVAEALEQLYLPVTALVNKGRFKLSQVQQQADSSASAAAAADAKAAAEAEAAAAGAQAAAEAGEEVPPAAGEEIVAAPAAGQAAAAESKDSSGSNTERLLLRLLAALRSAAVKSLAEVSAGQLMLLLALGRSLASVPRYGKPLDDGLTWPPESGATATLLRQQAEAMLADLTQLAGSFSAAAPALLATLQQTAAAAATTGQQAWLVEQGQQLQAQAVEEVGVDCSAAVAQVRDGFGKLLYVVLLASLHREGLQQKQQGPLQPQQQQGQQQPELMQDNEGEQEQA